MSAFTAQGGTEGAPASALIASSRRLGSALGFARTASTAGAASGVPIWASARMTDGLTMLSPFACSSIDCSSGIEAASFCAPSPRAANARV